MNLNQPLRNLTQAQLSMVHTFNEMQKDRVRRAIRNNPDPSAITSIPMLTETGEIEHRNFSDVELLKDDHV